MFYNLFEKVLDLTTRKLGVTIMYLLDPNYPWQACLDSNSNSYYFWNMETNEVQWEPPMGFQFHSTVSNDDNDEEYSRTSFEQDGIFSNDRDDDGDGNEDRQDDDDDDENHSITCDQGIPSCLFFILSVCLFIFKIVFVYLFVCFVHLVFR